MMTQVESKINHLYQRTGRNVPEEPPKISVVIPAYNAAKFIGETLESAIGQTFRNHEIIVVNDGSPDTEELERAMLGRLEDIIYIKQSNAGAGMARNTAIDAARGDIIAFLDSDDVWRPDYLESQYAWMQHNSLDLVYCDAILFGMHSTSRKTFMETAPSIGKADFASILDCRCNVITSGTMARKQVIIDAGMFERDRVQAEDFHLWLRMAKNGARIGYQREQLLKYRVRLDSLSGDSVSQVERGIDAFQRVTRTIDLTDDEREVVRRRVTGLEANLALEHGKAYLLRGDFRQATVAFRTANLYRGSLKLAAIWFLSRVAPRILVRHYLATRSAEIPFIRKGENLPDH